MRANRRRAARLAPIGGGAAAALLAALLAAPPLAAPSTRAGCVSLRGVTGFKGHASLSFNQSATGNLPADPPGSAGSETISLSRSATGLQLKFNKRIGVPVAGIPTVFFGGKVTSGSVSVDDRLGFSNDASAGGQVADHGTPTGSGGVGLFPKVCIYQLLVGFNEHTSYSGEQGFGPGLTVVDGSAYTPRTKIPASLHLAGSAVVSAYYDGCLNQDVPDEQGCYQFGGGWAVDFETLFLCGATSGGVCQPNDQEQGSANVTWSLTPTYAAKKKKK